MSDANKNPDANKNMDPRKLEDLYHTFESADYIVRKRYRADLENYGICNLQEPLQTSPCDDEENSQDICEIGDNVQFFRIKELVYNKSEDITNKLMTVYHTMSSYPNTGVVMLLYSDGSEIELYMGVLEHIDADGKVNLKRRGKKCATLKSAFEANFLGSRVDEFEETQDPKEKKPLKSEEIIKKIFDNVKAVSCVSSIATLRGNDTNGKDGFVQGLEKLVDTMKGKAFSAVFIADCKGINEIEAVCAGYEDIYSKLSPFAQSQQTIGRSSGETETNSFIEGVTDTISDSIAETVSNSHGTNKFSSDSVGGNAQFRIPIIKLPVGVNYTHGRGEGESDTEANSKTNTHGTGRSLSKQNSVAKSLTESTSDGLQINFQNRSVKTLMDRIDEQIKHLHECEAYGVFDFCCYFLAEDRSITMTAASVYDSLMQGDNSGNEVSSVNTWIDENDNKNASAIIKYLKRFYHPIVAGPNLAKPKDDKSGEFEPIGLTPSVLVSGKELALHMGLPRRSVLGVPVYECVPFGREVVSHTVNAASSEGISLGKLYHMRQPEENTQVVLNRDSLAAHTFITGSTGAGKSNAIYTLLNALCPQKQSSPHFLVIEPAKGEYKDVFGGRSGVKVYSTNPKKAELLRINPFSFPEDTHVLEHIDRLVEVFNACWPMYAAMPAVLKAAIEKAYIRCGWSLSKSKCWIDDREDETNDTSGDHRVFPTFIDVMDMIPKVVDVKGFSGDTQGDYKGALLTRLESLTNGINGQVLCAVDEIQDSELFDKNVIVDLSRVGSMETKALLMGILVLKLQEYRMAQRDNGNDADKLNQGLQHITVLEEAHNLLRRTSSEQSQEGSNLQGKSVEMLTNAIAEMRTYGEGFIIADQAPGLLDMAVIRNTNTKIILRLPDESDRVLVGKAAGLNDDQIAELSKLDTGVAAVYQNDWLEPVLCMVDKFTDTKPLELKDGSDSQEKASLTNKFWGWLLDLNEYTFDEVDKQRILRQMITRLKAPKTVEDRLLQVLSSKSRPEIEHVQYMIDAIMDGRQLFADSKQFNNPDRYVEWEIMEKLQVEAQTAELMRQQIGLSLRKRALNVDMVHEIERVMNIR